MPTLKGPPVFFLLLQRFQSSFKRPILSHDQKTSSQWTQGTEGDFTIATWRTGKPYHTCVRSLNVTAFPRPSQCKVWLPLLEKQTKEWKKKKKRWDWENWKQHFSGRLLLINMLKTILTPFLTTVTNLTGLQISILGLSSWMSVSCQNLLGPVMGLIISTQHTTHIKYLTRWFWGTGIWGKYFEQKKMTSTVTPPLTPVERKGRLSPWENAGDVSGSPKWHVHLECHLVLGTRAERLGQSHAAWPGELSLPLAAVLFQSHIFI